MSRDPTEDEQNRRIAETLEAERPRLRNFILKSVASQLDAEDILQDVFSELVEAYRLVTPIKDAGAWLFRVARNRIVDRFRRKATEGAMLAEPAPRHRDEDGDDEEYLLDDFPSLDAGPDEVYERSVLLAELAAALAELPAEQREVFLAHEVEGRSFRELAAATGLSINTLLGRKRYAVLHLRARLRNTYLDFTVI
ncbi:MAG TPA: sigma-70 family RNA polymerase sigma factor [Thermoanaerobaculia bacterium]|nr:sigma-70 family RNA polymerase sigma factor [Thermoanaerobaculia bacterium]